MSAMETTTIVVTTINTSTNTTIVAMNTYNDNNEIVVTPIIFMLKIMRAITTVKMTFKIDPVPTKT